MHHDNLTVLKAHINLNKMRAPHRNWGLQETLQVSSAVTGVDYPIIPQSLDIALSDIEALIQEEKTK